MEGIAMKTHPCGRFIPLVVHREGEAPAEPQAISSRRFDEDLASTISEFRDDRLASGTAGDPQAGAPRPLALSVAVGAAVVLVAASFNHSAIAGDVPKQSVLVVVGAGGNEEYSRQFRLWAERWKSAAERGGAEFAAIGLEQPEGSSDRERLQQRLAERSAASTEPLWLVLIGHGTYDGKTARFNLAGPDVSEAELGEWVRAVKRPVAIINTASSSGPFLAELSAPDRVVITATRSGSEFNYARLGDFLSSALVDPAADLDKDDQVSLLEAWLQGAARTREFYSSEARLATEHALIDDNGDKQGTPADWFRGVRAIKAAKDGAALDGPRAAQFVLVKSPGESELPPEVRASRDELERELAELRAQKPHLAEEEYLQRLEGILLDLGRLYGEIGGPTVSPSK